MEGDVNPVRDLEIISEELRLKDGECLKKAMVRGAQLVTRMSASKCE